MLIWKWAHVPNRRHLLVCLWVADLSTVDFISPQLPKINKNKIDAGTLASIIYWKLSNKNLAYIVDSVSGYGLHPFLNY